MKLYNYYCSICLNPISNPTKVDFQSLESLLGFFGLNVKNVRFCYVCKSRLKTICRMRANCFKAQHILNEWQKKTQNDSRNIAEFQNICLNAKDWLLRLSVSVTTFVDIEPKKEDNFSFVKEESNLDCGYENLIDVKEENFENVANESILDSDEDLPLASIKSKNGVSTKKDQQMDKTQNVTEKEPPKDYIEIILSREQQLEEVMQRSKSVNYLNSAYKCDLCYKGFVCSKAYQKHTDKHDMNNQHPCTICLMRYETDRQLKAHFNSSHAKHYKCTRCPHLSRTVNSAREHARWHGGHHYKCHLCGEEFRVSTSYLTHIRKKHASNHACAECGHSFVGEVGLRLHKSKTHGHRLMNENQDQNEDIPCKECGIRFASEEAWCRHILVSHKHRRTDGYHCAICNMVIPSKDVWVAHIKAHLRKLKGDKKSERCAEAFKVSCEDCGAKFRQAIYLLAHRKRMHLGIKNGKVVVCEVCGKRCASNAFLRYHQRTHTGEKPHECAKCGRRFSDKNNLRIHNRTHSGERPYACEVCSRTFTQRPALTRHTRVHTGVKPYECQYCGKSFTQSNSLKTHVNAVHLKLPVKRKKSVATDSVLEKIED